MTWTPTENEIQDYEEICEWVGSQPQGGVGVRVLCPRGHLVSHVGLFLLGHRPDGPLTMQPAMEHKSGYYADALSPVGFRKVRLLCKQKGCGYKGTHIHDRLALDLGRHARRGNLEYRVIA